MKNSIRTKITLLIVSAIIIAIGLVTFVGVESVKEIGMNDADRILHLMCQNGTMTLESYFTDVERSAETVASLVQGSLNDSSPEDLEYQIERARNLFDNVATNTNGVLTYYFRIDPEVSDTLKGFWYVNLDGKGFEEYETTDISQYDTNDTSAIVWFTVPKATKKGVWLPPYNTETLNIKVISYNVPVYQNDKFIGVIGIEIDYKTLASEVENIKFFNTGYAFVVDENSNIIYHPQMDSTLQSGEKLAIASPSRVIGENHIEYIYDGVEKQAVWQPLSNGMRLYVTVPINEINKNWQDMIIKIIYVSTILLLIILIISLQFSEYLTKPLHDLTIAAQQLNNEIYDFDLNYNRNDEVGILTKTFKELASHTKEHINNLNKQIYIDALTSVRNKGGYGLYIQDLQNRMDNPDEELEFAFCVFDCDNLKVINDTYGHDKGDLYLKNACRLICKVFKHSPVFRIGGDEFAVVLENDDYKNREQLFELFNKRKEELIKTAENPWEKVGVTMGYAIYEPHADMAVIDVARKADRNMYTQKPNRR